MSPEVSDEMVLEGDGGGMSSWKVVETGVLRSQDMTPVRRRLEGGKLEAEGEKGGFSVSRSDMSPETTEERGEPGDSAIGDGWEWWRSKGAVEGHRKEKREAERQG